jgi:hypothetical protein
MFLFCSMGGVMVGPVRNWRFELIEAYPDIFHPLPDHPGVAQASPECGAGWRALLEHACARIRAAVQADGGSFRATQIKEKYATLRFYWESALSPEADAEVDEIIDLAEARSACTCEQCGKPGRPFNRGGWFMTACDEHGKGEPDAERRDLEKVHVVYRIVDGEPVPCGRRYDRSTDSFEMARTADWRIDLMRAHPRLFEVMSDELERSFGYPLCEAG